MVVIVDGSDRLDNTRKPSGRTQPEYIFIDRSQPLRQLNGHVIYAIPLSLTLSNHYDSLKRCFGIEPTVLPMVPVRRRDLTDCEEGMALLRQIVLVRAFPDLPAQERLELITELFDSLETLDRLCRVSGGHVRNLVGLLYSCLTEQDPPFSRSCQEMVIKRYREDLIAAIDDREWTLLFQALKRHNLRGEEEYQVLLRSMFLFEYHDDLGRWYWVNPVLEDSLEFQAW